MLPRAATLPLLLSVILIAFTLTACGDADEEGQGGDAACTPTTPAQCGRGQVKVDEMCEGCDEVMDNCGDVAWCMPDPTCDAPCPAGQFEEFDAAACGEEDCEQRMACGEIVTCRDQASCLAEATCPDGGLPLANCDGVSSCLPTFICGAELLCAALSECARSACDAGETPAAKSCEGQVLPCRDVDVCGDTFSCVCRTDDLMCDGENERLSNSPCVGGEMCREILACNQTYYCKGGSI